MARWVRAIRHGWVVEGGVPGPDVDEFAEATEVMAALAGPRGGGDTLLAVQHPHRTPEALADGLSLAAALPAARRALDRLRASAYRQVDEVVAPYRVDGPDGVAVGVLCLVDSAAVDGAGRRPDAWRRKGLTVRYATDPGPPGMAGTAARRGAGVSVACRQRSPIRPRPCRAGQRRSVACDPIPTPATSWWSAPDRPV